MDKTTTRRTIVKTGTKVAYAAPLVAVSFKLSGQGVGAISGDDGCSPSSGQTCGSYEACGTTPAGNPCVCHQTVANTTVCGAYGTCTTPCNTNGDCAVVTGFYGDTGPGFCHTGTCCTVPAGFTGICAPLCRP